MSSKAKKRLNRLLRMSGRTFRSVHNAEQHLRSRLFEQDVAKGGMAELERLAEAEIRGLAAREAEAQRLRSELLGNFDGI